jgi:hypothetical protein
MSMDVDGVALAERDGLELDHEAPGRFPEGPSRRRRG